MDAFGQLFQVSAAYVLVLILNRDRLRLLWLLLGLFAGLGLLTKVTMLFFGFAVFIALLLTPARRHLLAPWPWLGGAVAFAFLLPYLLWQVSRGWPTLEFWGDYGGKVDEASPVEFLVEQIVTMQPPTLPLWLAGLGFYLFAREGGRTGLWAGSTSSSSFSSRRWAPGSTSSPRPTPCCSPRGAWRSSGSATPGGAVAGAGP
ncbi:MAG: glycosyltransferase family 39 protein [Actinomycetota bacterium]|nr:glycosyltransferase family 39 protein [Actinomycetota bacterium]